jgi:hypothetical protein
MERSKIGYYGSLKLRDFRAFIDCYKKFNIYRDYNCKLPAILFECGTG